MTHRTGVLGGTFDPVHIGHLALAEAAGKLCHLDEILLLPAAVPPHKNKIIATFTQRTDMLEIALKDSKVLNWLSIEQFLPTPSFTIDTLHYLQIHSVAPVEFYFITGADAFLDIPHWKEGYEILKTVNCIVFSRTGIKNKKLSKFLEDLSYEETDKGWFNSVSGKWVYCSFLPLPDVASSIIRQRTAKGLSIEKLVPTGVAEYIAENSLYSTR